MAVIDPTRPMTDYPIALIEAMADREFEKEDVAFLMRGLGLEPSEARAWIIASFRKQLWQCGVERGWEEAMKSLRGGK